MNFDAVVVGGGHNGLVTACYLALAGKRVCVFEAQDVIGGAAISATPFQGVAARLSQYSYLISLLPKRVIADLGLDLRTVRRTYSSYTPVPGSHDGLLVPLDDEDVLKAQFGRVTGDTDEALAWRDFYGTIAGVATPLFDSLTQPMPSAATARDWMGDQLWHDFVEQPLGAVIERTFRDDLVRGVVLTDGLIGTFAEANDESLLQNICFLYHVIGNGTGDWDVPIGGMGALTGALAIRARSLGVEIVVNARVTAIESTPQSITVTADVEGTERSVTTFSVAVNAAPRELQRLRGMPVVDETDPARQGAQLKVNMVLKHLPRLKDHRVSPEQAFSGTFHINEYYSQLQDAYESARHGSVPDPVPAEIYCHSLTDPSILGPDLQAEGAQTLTVFALHLPHALFAEDNSTMRERALAGVLASLNSVLDEPIEECLYLDADGKPCIEAKTTVDLEQTLGLPTGNIFHTSLDWPWASHPDEVGSWGVETDDPRIVICGSGARRGGGVSGIPGHNAAKALLQIL